MATDHDASGAPTDKANPTDRADQHAHCDDLGRNPDTSPPGATGNAPGPSPDDDPDAPSTASEGEDDQPTGQHSSTDQPTGTAPRAVLRPVPEGFPTPPPRPARPNRAPALPVPEPEPPRRSRLLLAALIGIAVLALVIGIVGSVIAVRALSGSGDASPTDPGASDTPAAGTDEPTTGSEDTPGTAGGTVTIGEVTVTEVSTETGLAEVTGGGRAKQSTGQFVVVVVEVENASDRSVIITNTSLQLETTDGEVRPADRVASEILEAPTEPRGVADAQESTRVHAVFDVPEDAEPASVHIDLAGNQVDASGELPLGG